MLYQDYWNFDWHTIIFSNIQLSYSTEDNWMSIGTFVLILIILIWKCVILSLFNYDEFIHQKSSWIVAML